jgi:hypothetical protein
MIHPATPLPAGVTQIASCFRDNEVGHRRAPADAASSKPTGEHRTRQRATPTPVRGSPSTDDGCEGGPAGV